MVWRTLRRFGVRRADADDAAQQVFLVLAGRLADVATESERAFLVGAAIRVAANDRRRQARHLEDPLDDEALDARSLTPEELLEWKERRRALDLALDQLNPDQRAVFVLYELEGFSLPEIARTLNIPLGTATSRLRRGREAFESWISSQEPGK